MLQNITKLPDLDVIGKQVTQISTEMFGSSGDFRELFKLTGISPITPQTAIDAIGKIPEVQKLQTLAGKLSGDLSKFTEIVKKANSDIVKIDWLN